MYALVDDETGDRIGEFQDIQRFFVADAKEHPAVDGFMDGRRELFEFEIARMDLHVEPARLFDHSEPSNLVVEILSTSEQRIGEYSLASAVLNGREDKTSGLFDIAVTASVDWVPRRQAKAIWQSWAVAPPAREGVWAELPLGSRDAWLEVVGLYRGPRISRRPNGVLEFSMDGRNVDDLTSFFCAIGEAMNGPGGYYGWNFQALVDCLNGGCGPSAPFVIRWSEFDVAQRSLVVEVDSAGRRISQLELAVRILEEAGVEIRFE